MPSLVNNSSVVTVFPYRSQSQMIEHWMAAPLTGLVHVVHTITTHAHTYIQDKKVSISYKHDHKIVKQSLLINEDCLRLVLSETIGYITHCILV